MHLIDAIMAAGWAMQPRVLSELLVLAERHERGEKVEPATVSQIVSQRNALMADRMAAFEGAIVPPAALTASIEESPIAPNAVSDLAAQGKTPAYFLVEDVAVVPIQGVLAKHSTMVNGMSQPVGMAYSRIGRAVSMAAEDPRVRSILLDINSPGGMVSGVQDAYSEIERAGKTKPVIAYAHDTAASAAYWLAAAAGQILLSPAAVAGSIGVYTIHEDISGALADRKIKRTLIASGPHKGAGAGGTPLNSDQLAGLQSEVGAMAAQFFSYVGKRRGLSDARLGAVTDGRVFIGPDAVSMGLADKVVTPREAIAFAQQRAQKPAGKVSMNWEEINDSQIASMPKSTIERVSKAHKLVPEGSAPTTPTAPAKPATIGELKAAFPGDPSYALDAAEKSMSLLEARANYTGVLAARLKEAQDSNAALAAQVEQLKASTPASTPATNPATNPAASTQPKLAPAGIAPLAQNGAENGMAAVATRVREIMDKNNCDRATALHKLATGNAADKALHAAWRAAKSPRLEV